MNNTFVGHWLLLGACLVQFSCNSTNRSGLLESGTPNVIVILTDDQGYQDLGCYGSLKIETPHIDKMAEEGIRFTNFYVASSVCSASRAALLTGRRPARNGVAGVFMPESKGMDSKEVTIAEVLKSAGYTTACFGKWHLGDFDANLPTGQGFDEYFGIPYSNDMYIGASQKFSSKVKFLEGYTLELAKNDQQFVAAHKKDRRAIHEKGLRDLCPLLEGNEIVEYPADQGTLTSRYFSRAKRFIEESKGTPFFIYLTPAMPHVPLFASEDFKGKSAGGLYGDVIEEIDWNVGQLLQYLKENGLDENTMVIYTSDNGPWLGKGEHAGSALPLRDGKFSNYEGGVRVPCVMRWPGKWAANEVSDEVFSTLDFLPTIAYYTQATFPDVPLDGANISSHLEAPDRSIKRSFYLYNYYKEIGGIRKGEWKYLPHGGKKKRDATCVPELYNLQEDISESKNLVNQYSDLVIELEKEMKKVQNGWE